MTTQQAVLPLPKFEGIRPAGMKVSVTGNIKSESAMPRKVADLALGRPVEMPAEGHVASVLHGLVKDDDLIRGVKVVITRLGNGSSADSEPVSLPMFEGVRPRGRRISLAGSLTDEGTAPPVADLKLGRHMNLVVHGRTTAVTHQADSNGEVTRVSKLAVERLETAADPQQGLGLDIDS